MLGEVSFGVEQSQADQRKTEIGGFLQVIAGQHAQAARIDGQHFMQPKFHRKVGDGLVLYDFG